MESGTFVQCDLLSCHFLRVSHYPSDLLSTSLPDFLIITLRICKFAPRTSEEEELPQYNALVKI